MRVSEDGSGTAITEIEETNSLALQVMDCPSFWLRPQIDCWDKEKMDINARVVSVHQQPIQAVVASSRLVIKHFEAYHSRKKINASVDDTNVTVTFML